MKIILTITEFLGDYVSKLHYLQYGKLDRFTPVFIWKSHLYGSFSSL